MKGGRIALPQEYFTGEQTNNYVEGDMPNMGSRNQIGCDNFYGPDNEVVGRDHVGEQSGAGRRRRRRSVKRNNNRNGNNNNRKASKRRSGKANRKGNNNKNNGNN